MTYHASAIIDGATPGIQATAFRVVVESILTGTPRYGVPYPSAGRGSDPSVVYQTPAPAVPVDIVTRTSVSKGPLPASGENAGVSAVPARV